MEHYSTKEYVHTLLTVDEGGKLSRTVDWLIAGLIVLNTVTVALATVDGIFRQYHRAFYVIEVTSVALFTVEYGLRLWSASVLEGHSRPIIDRLRYACRPYLLVDLFAILPFYLGAAVFVSDLRFLRALQLFRFLRLFKLVRYSEAMQRFIRVIRKKRDDLLLAAVGSSLLITVASHLMYFLEKDAQPETFSSVPATLWWAVITLTTVGYGDVYPITPAGKLLGAIIAVIGVGLVALPASILASGYLEVESS